jgi:hypothetical protein
MKCLSGRFFISLTTQRVVDHRTSRCLFSQYERQCPYHRQWFLMDLAHCSLCQRSLPQRGHVYSKTHRASVDRVCSRFVSKIVPAREAVRRPVFGVADFSVQFWCYFCERDVSVHAPSEFFLWTSGQCCLYFGMVEHLAGTEHERRVADFFKSNCIRDKNQAEYLLSPSQRAEFHINAQQLMDRLQRKRPSSAGAEAGAADHACIVPTPTPTPTPPPTVSRPKPPLKPADKYPNRVGAHFDRSQPFPDDWLPNFGAVWEHGSRARSLAKYRRQTRARGEAGDTTTSATKKEDAMAPVGAGDDVRAAIPAAPLIGPLPPPRREPAALASGDKPAVPSAQQRDGDILMVKAVQYEAPCNSPASGPVHAGERVVGTAVRKRAEQPQHSDTAAVALTTPHTLSSPPRVLHTLLTVLAPAPLKPIPLPPVPQVLPASSSATRPVETLFASAAGLLPRHPLSASNSVQTASLTAVPSVQGAADTPLPNLMFSSTASATMPQPASAPAQLSNQSKGPEAMRGLTTIAPPEATPPSHLVQQKQALLALLRQRRS